MTVFPADGEAAASAERGARALVAQAHQARQFTDTASFTLRCADEGRPAFEGLSLADVCSALRYLCMCRCSLAQCGWSQPVLLHNRRS